MTLQPTLETQRLILRPFSLTDAPQVQRLAGAFEIADTTLNIPHPYEDGKAEEWISTLQPGFEQGLQFVCAIQLRADNLLCGAIGLRLRQQHAHAEMGYWLGRPYWNRGYITEASQEILRYAFENLGLNRIYALHVSRNPASGRVMQKAGMIHEGRLRQHVRKWDRFEDLEQYGILKQEWMSLHKKATA